MSILDAQQRRRLHQQLLKKGAEINERLVQLLNSGTSSGDGLPVAARPGERPEERMRRFLDLLDRKIQASREGGQGYGRCASCGDVIPLAELEQVPWAEKCLACAEKDGSS